MSLSTASRKPVQSVTIEGNPQAEASMTEIPKPSVVEAKFYNGV